jgi:hypothetical protein
VQPPPHWQHRAVSEDVIGGDVFDTIIADTPKAAKSCAYV